MALSRLTSKFFLRIVLFSILAVILVIPTGGNSWAPSVQLTRNLADDYDPALSSNGGRIAFISSPANSPELFVMDSKEANPTQLTSNQGLECCPSISGDGSKIVFQSDIRGDWEVFLIDAVGTIPPFCPRPLPGTGCQLTDNRDDDVSPVMNAQGSRIAFVSNRDGDPEIFTVNIDGTGLAQLTFNQAVDGNPSISGDGSLIAFDSNVGIDFEVFIVRSDASPIPSCTLKVASTGCQLTDNLSSQDQFPSISSDGSKIAFASTGPAIALNLESDYIAPGLLPTGQSVVMVVNSDGTGLKVLTSNSKDNFDPQISGDGAFVSFISTVDGDRDVYVVRVDGSELAQVTNTPALDTQPRLNYDGTLLVYVSNLDGDLEMYMSQRAIVKGGSGARYFPR